RAEEISAPEAVTAVAKADVSETAVVNDVKATDSVKSQKPQTQLRALQEYIGSKYKVPTKSVKSLVDTAWEVGGAMKLDPLLLLAVMAIESSFNPRAESHKGAQGLMQVMTRIHHKKFEPFGGRKAAWAPDAIINVGAQILKDCIERRGSVSGGLTCYVGSAGTSSQYGRKVLAERKRLEAALAPSGAPSLLVAQADVEDQAKVKSKTKAKTPTVDEDAARIVAENSKDQVALNEVTASLTLRTQSM
nr:transglycosylase SLT domain-containing protein [Pseudomonas sp.]